VPPAGTANDALGVEKPPSLARKFVELLFYVVVLNGAYVHLTGLATVRFASGGLVLGAGLLTFFLMKAQGERLPVSVWFALIFAAAANVSQLRYGELPLIGEGLPGITHWISYLIMMCYLVRNSATQKRVLLFSAFLVVGLVISGGGMHKGAERLMLQGVGAGFSNANALAYASGLFAVALLFYSLRSPKVLRPFLWGLAAVLTYCLFLTVSRGGAITMACGVAVLLGAILTARGVRLGGVILVGVAVVAVSQLAYLLSESVTYLEERLQTESERTLVYQWETLNDLAETLVFGRGPSAIITSAGFTAHNTFLYAHTAYGGMAAYPYLLWLIVLMVRITRMMFARDHPMDAKLLVVALFGMGLAAQLLSNQGQLFYCVVYATAITEKYTAPYSHRRIAQRKTTAWPAAFFRPTPAGGLQPLYR
jgi:hypothetical protein